MQEQLVQCFLAYKGYEDIILISEALEKSKGNVELLLRPEKTLC